MTQIRFDSGTKIAIANTTTTIAAATGSVGSCGSAAAGGVAGVSAIEVGETQLTGVVEFAAGSGASVSASGNVVTIGATSATRLRDMTDVAITTDEYGEPIIAEGAVLRFQTFPGSTLGVWIADDTLDGGGYL